MAIRIEEKDKKLTARQAAKKIIERALEHSFYWSEQGILDGTHTDQEYEEITIQLENIVNQIEKRHLKT